MTAANVSIILAMVAGSTALSGYVGHLEAQKVKRAAARGVWRDRRLKARP